MGKQRQDGVTFLEVLIAIVIVGITLSAIFTGINFASKYARHNANKTMALNLAQALMEDLKDTPYSDLQEITDTILLYQELETNIQAARSADIVDAGSYKEVTVDVSWTWLGKQYSEELNTLRYNY